MRSFAIATVALSTLLGWQAVVGAQQASRAPAPTFGGPGVSHIGDKGVTPPQAVKDVKPQYTPEAMKANIQGIVTLECVVKADGTVGDVRVVKSLDETYGLDDEAVKTAKQWRFKPGRKNGKPVPVVISLDFTFTQK
jgi:TonB family protein